MIAARLSDCRFPFPIRPLSLAAATAWTLSAEAAALPVANSSFELPVTGSVVPQIDLWSRPPGQDQLSGVFANTAIGAPNHIDNLDGNQAAFLLAVPTAGISQILDSQFEAGLQYTMTVGMLAGGNITEANSLSLQLFYLDDAGQSKVLASFTVDYSPAEFPTVTHLVDQHVASGVLQAGEAPVGKNIGLQIVANSGDGTGYWDLDNVRVTASAVPEPGTWALLALGLGGLIAAGRRNVSRS